MWILDSSGDVLKGKRYWLRPGQEFTLGRNPNSRIDLSAFKTVSKLHLTIKISNVTPGSAGNLNSRTTVTIQDHASKFGTWLDGAEVKNRTVTATGTSHTLKVAKMPDTLRLSWEPIVFTNAGSRAAKVRQLTEKLEPFEIKFIKEYTNQTTYVMSPKINTAKGLAALIHQKYIVTDLFADALYSCLTSIDDVLDPDSLPDPMEFLPTTGEYPTELFRPDHARMELFKGITFIFLDEGQYNNLVTPINAGLGKGVVFDPEEKSVDDLVKFAKNKGQVLLIQRNLDEDDDLCIEAARRLGHQSITQGSFLAPVLRVERSLLLKPVVPTPETSVSSQTLGRPTPISPTTPELPPSAPTEIPDSMERPPADRTITDLGSPTPVKPKLRAKPRPRQVASTQVDLFDDFFANTTTKQATQIKKSPRKSISQRRSSDNFDPFSEMSPTKPPLPTPAPVTVPPEEEEEEDFAPAATEMRKHLAAKGTQSSLAESDPEETTPQDSSKSKSKSSKKRSAPEEDEVLLAAKERKRVATEHSRAAAEQLAAAVKDHAHLKNLGEVEVFHVNLSVAPRTREERDGRWNPMWNGRKNFKKFRKAKQSVSVGNLGREMIRLVDYQGKSAASQEYFFPVPERGSNGSMGGIENTADNTFSMDDTPVTTTSRGSKPSQRSSKQSSNRSGRSGRQELFVQDEDSDNDLAFD